MHNPCLPTFFSETYSAAPGFFAMLGIFSQDLKTFSFFLLKGVLGMHMLELISSYYMAKIAAEQLSTEEEGLTSNKLIHSHKDYDEIEDLHSGIEHAHSLLAVTDKSNWVHFFLLLD